MDKQINLQVCYTCTWFHKSIWKIKFHWRNHHFFSSWCQSFNLNDIKFLSLAFASAKSITCVLLTCTHTYASRWWICKTFKQKKERTSVNIHVTNKIWHSVKCAEVICGHQSPEGSGLGCFYSFCYSQNGEFLDSPLQWSICTHFAFLREILLKITWKTLDKWYGRNLACIFWT